MRTIKMNSKIYFRDRKMCKIYDLFKCQVVRVYGTRMDKLYFSIFFFFFYGNFCSYKKIVKVANNL